MPKLLRRIGIGLMGQNLVAGKVGSDSVASLGMTCHHVIPFDMLEKFYNYCKEIEDRKVKEQFQKWMFR